MPFLITHSYLNWYVINRRRKAAILVEPKGHDVATPEGFYHQELNQRSDLTGRAIAHGIPFK